MYTPVTKGSFLDSKIKPVDWPVDLKKAEFSFSLTSSQTDLEAFRRLGEKLNFQEKLLTYPPFRSELKMLCADSVSGEAFVVKKSVAPGLISGGGDIIESENSALDYQISKSFEKEKFDLKELLKALWGKDESHYHELIRNISLSEYSADLFKEFITKELFTYVLPKTKPKIKQLLCQDYHTIMLRLPELLNDARHQRLNIILRSAVPMILKKVTGHKYKGLLHKGIKLKNSQIQWSNVADIFKSYDVVNEVIAGIENEEITRSLYSECMRKFDRIVEQWFRVVQTNLLAQRNEVRSRLGMRPSDFQYISRQLLAALRVVQKSLN